jgi:transposase
VAELDAERARLRAELAKLRAENAELRRERQLFAEQLGALVEVNRELRERVAELERRLAGNSRNSHRPPSSEGYEKPPPRSRRRSGRKPGGQPGAPGSTLAQVADPDEVVVYRPRRCASCRRSLREAPVTSTEVRQVADLPPVALRWTEHRLEHRRCACGQVTMAGAEDGVPGHVRAPTSYGPVVRAVATYLVAEHHLPLDRAAAVLSDLLAAPVSPGSISAWVAAAGAALDPFLDRVRGGLATADVAHFDETGLRVDTQLAWVHSASTRMLTLYTAHDRRGREAMDVAGVLPKFRGVAVHDCWAPYFGYPVTHAICNAHVLRELTAVWEHNGQAWAAKLAATLERLNVNVLEAKRSGADALDPAVLAGWHARYDALVAAGGAANPEPNGGWRGKRPVAVNLLDRLGGRRDDILRFSVDFRVPFTNNTAERDIRPVKIRQKISGCLRSMAGATAFCAVRSYLSTVRKHGRDALTALRELHDGHPWLPDPAPS